jgi:hypothetical protein
VRTRATSKGSVWGGCIHEANVFVTELTSLRKLFRTVNAFPQLEPHVRFAQAPGAAGPSILTSASSYERPRFPPMARTPVQETQQQIDYA